MNVSAPYPNAMNSPTRATGPRDFDDTPRGKQARFDNHDDFYAFLESNRGPGGVINPAQIHQAQGPPQQRGMPMAQNSPQGPPADQSRPPVTNTFVPQRSASGRSRPPSYSGSRSEEMLVDRAAENSRRSNGDLHKVQRQNGRRGGGRPPTSAGPSDHSPPQTGGSSPQRRSDPARPGSSDSLNPAAVGGNIQRLKSPSVMSSVLQPLDQKVKEYKGFMHQEQDEMTRLDDEIRALQERRAQAEMRYLDAKNKHDDYHRQYQDVERALRGEPPLQRELPQRPIMQQQRTMSVRDEDEDYDDEDYEPHPPPVQRRMDSQQSFSRTSQKGSFGARFRSSLFGGR